MTKCICDRCKKELTKTEVDEVLMATDGPFTIRCLLVTDDDPNLCHSCVRAIVAAAPKPKPPPKPRVVIERKECWHLGGGFHAELTVTEQNQWARYARRNETWCKRERSCEQLLRARAQSSADIVNITHKNFLNYDWLVHELAECWYAELKQRDQAMEDKTDG